MLRTTTLIHITYHNSFNSDFVNQTIFAARKTTRVSYSHGEDTTLVRNSYSLHQTEPWCRDHFIKFFPFFSCSTIVIRDKFRSTIPPETTRRLMVRNGINTIPTRAPISLVRYRSYSRYIPELKTPQDNAQPFGMTFHIYHILLLNGINTIPTRASIEWMTITPSSGQPDHLSGPVGCFTFQTLYLGTVLLLDGNFSVTAFYPLC